MVKRILAVCCISFNDFKATVLAIYKKLAGDRYNILQQRMYSENCVLNCHFRWYVLSLICNKCKHDKHTIRIMFKYDYKNAILLDKLRNGEDFISFLIWIHCIHGVG